MSPKAVCETSNQARSFRAVAYQHRPVAESTGSGAEPGHLPPDLGGRSSWPKEENIRTWLISHVTSQVAPSMHLQMLKGGKGPRARRSGSSAGHRFSLALPRQPWTDSHCRDKDTEGASSVRRFSAGQTSTAARASVKNSRNHVHSVSRTLVHFGKRNLNPAVLQPARFM